MGNGRSESRGLVSSRRLKAHRGGLFCSGLFNECPVMGTAASGELVVICFPYRLAERWGSNCTDNLSQLLPWVAAYLGG